MAPPVSPRGSHTGSQGQVEPALPPQGARDESNFGLALELGPEFSFVAAGTAGSPVRFGLLAQLRPIRPLAVGLHLDSNFSDELTAQIRGEGAVAAHQIFDFYGAFQGGIRALFGQEHFIPELEAHRPVSGVLPLLGIELGGRFHVNDFNFDLFANFAYSPPSGISVPVTLNEFGSNPSGGTNIHPWFLGIGLRGSYGITSEPSTVPKPAEEIPPAPVAEREPALPQTRQSLQDLQERVESIIHGGEITPPPQTGSTDPAHPDRERILAALQEHLSSLMNTLDTLEEELHHARQAYRDWNDGTEDLLNLHIRMDRITYGQLSLDPPQPNLEEINTLGRDFLENLQENEALRFRLRQRDEAYSSADLMTREFRAFTVYLASTQRHYYGAGDPNINPSDFDDAILNFSQARRLLAELREEDQLLEFRPSNSLQTEWRQTLEEMEQGIGQLNGDVPQEIKDELRTRYQTLHSNFDQEVANVEREQNYWNAYHGITDALYAHRTAVYRADVGTWREKQDRARSAVENLQTIRRTLENNDEGFRHRFRRSFLNFTNFLKEFLDGALPSSNQTWYEAAQQSIAILQIFEPDYHAPSIQRPRSRPRRVSTRPQPRQGNGARPPERHQPTRRRRNAGNIGIPPPPEDSSDI